MKLGLTAILCDREPYIKEWICFHYLVGFRKFYLYTNRCTDDTISSIKQLKKSFDIKSFNVADSSRAPQFEAYRHAYREFNHEIDWMAFIDGDEFLFSPKNEGLIPCLEKFNYEKLSALGIHWACYGSSQHIDEPVGLIIENFNYRAELSHHKNKHIKSIVKGKQGSMIKIDNPHYFLTEYGTFDEKFRFLDRGGISQYEPTHQDFRINHYVTQSYNYYTNKKAKYLRPDNNSARGTSYWDEHNLNDVKDDLMLKFLPSLRNLISST
jgi:hypothetical protein